MMRLSLALFLFMGCGAPERPSLTQRWPAAQYWVEEGFGETAKEAGEDARTRMSARVRSKITARLAAIQREEGGEISTHVQREVTELTFFKHGELIRVVETGSHQDQVRAVAVLEKAAAIKRLRADYQLASAPFQVEITAALAARRDPRSFTARYAQARSLWPELLRSGLALNSLGDDSLDADRKRLRALVQAQGEILKAPIALSPFKDPLDGVVRAALLDAFKAEGLALSERCEHLRLTPSAEVRCAQSALGPRCELSLSARFTDCQGGERLTLQFEAAKLASVHPKSVEKARALLPQRVNAERLKRSLHGALKTLLPIENM